MIPVKCQFCGTILHIKDDDDREEPISAKEALGLLAAMLKISKEYLEGEDIVMGIHTLRTATGLVAKTMFEFWEHECD